MGLRIITDAVLLEKADFVEGRDVASFLPLAEIHVKLMLLVLASSFLQRVSAACCRAVACKAQCWSMADQASRSSVLIYPKLILWNSQCWNLIF